MAAGGKVAALEIEELKRMWESQYRAMNPVTDAERIDL
jgi:hypothetical protein